MFKYIGAGVGFYLSGFHFYGIFAGFIIGGIVDSFSRARHQQKHFEGSNQGGQQRFRSSQDIFNFYQRQTQRYDFPTMLLALSAAVMKADGKVLKSELDFVKQFLQQQFGSHFTQSHLQTLKTFLHQHESIPIRDICNDIHLRTRQEVRVQLLHYLFGIAQVDGSVSPAEEQTLKQIASLMGVHNMDFNSVKNMFHHDTESDYKILGTTKDATDPEVKKAYRKMAIRYHPDKVAQMGEEYQKGAKEKFQKIQEAYENIKKARKMA